MKMKISEIFYSVQGEIYVGNPAVFIRTVGCNISPICLWCDTKYSLTGGNEMSLEQIIQEVKKYKCKNIIITGGEPLLQKEEMFSLVEKLKEDNYKLDIETNGTIFDKRLKYFDKINCSPKEQAIDVKVLQDMCNFNTNFKFVYSNKQSFWWENIIQQLNLDNNRIYIMPEGETREKQLNKMGEVVEYCKERGYNFTPRLHILIWDKSRSV